MFSVSKVTEIYCMADDFYKEYVCKHLPQLFPRCDSYNRFVELEKEVLLPLTIFIKKVLLISSQNKCYL